MIFSVMLAITFASLALSITYLPDTGNINMKSPLAIFFVITILIALIVPMIFVFLFKELRITRTRRGLPVTKIASSLLLVMVVVYEISDLIYIIKSFEHGFDAWRFVRFIISFLLIVHLVLEILPSKIEIPTIVKHTANASFPLYTVLSVLVINFWGGAEPFAEYFEILFIICYALVTLFLLFDFKWKIISSNPKAYLALSSIAFVFASTISVASLIGSIARRDIFPPEQMFICILEMILIFTLSIYCLSKTLSVQATVAHIVELADEHKHSKGNN